MHGSEVMQSVRCDATYGIFNGVECGILAVTQCSRVDVSIDEWCEFGKSWWVVRTAAKSETNPAWAARSIPKS